MKKENKVEEILGRRIAQSLVVSPQMSEWLNNIKGNYDDGTDTNIRIALLDMSKELNLGLTFNDIDRGYQNWYPEGEGEVFLYLSFCKFLMLLATKLQEEK